MDFGDLSSHNHISTVRSVELKLLKIKDYLPGPEDPNPKAQDF